jgi:hypothetical protein
MRSLEKRPWVIFRLIACSDTPPDEACKLFATYVAAEVKMIESGQRQILT